MPNLQLKIPPLLLMLILATLMWLIAHFSPALSFSWSGATLCSLLLLMAGVFFPFAGAFSFRRAHTTVDPRYPERSAHLVTSGVYRLSRNPMYLGFLLLLAAWACYLSHVLAYLALPIWVSYLNRFQILPEEQALQTRFGETFSEYQTRVSRWL